MKLKNEVGMGGSKSTQTRFLGIITSTIHPYACFLDYHAPVDGDSLVLSLTERNLCHQVIMTQLAGMGRLTIALLPG